MFYCGECGTFHTPPRPPPPSKQSEPDKSALSSLFSIEYKARSHWTAWGKSRSHGIRSVSVPSFSSDLLDLIFSFSRASSSSPSSSSSSSSSPSSWSHFFLDACRSCSSSPLSLAIHGPHLLWPLLSSLLIQMNLQLLFFICP